MQIINNYGVYSTSVATTVTDIKKLILSTFQTSFSFYYLVCIIIMLSAAYLEFNLVSSQMKQEQVENACNKSCSWIPVQEQTFICSKICSICNFYWLVLDYYYMDTGVVEIIIACGFW